MNEREFQRCLVQESERAGGYAFKMSNRFMVGVPDLFIKIPDFPVVLLECKMGRPVRNVHYPSSRFTSSTGVTAQQARHLKRAQQAGVAAGWAVCVPGESGNCKIYVSVDVSGALGDVDAKGPNEFVRLRGRPWPVREIVEYVSVCSRG